MIILYLSTINIDIILKFIIVIQLKYFFQRIVNIKWYVFYVIIVCIVWNTSEVPTLIGSITQAYLLNIIK